MSWKLFLIIIPNVSENVTNVAFFVARQANQLGSPSRFERESDARSEQNGSSQLGRKVLLEGVILQCEIAKELNILLDVAGDLFNESTPLPRVVDKGDTLGEVVSNHMESRDSTESPSKVTQNLKLSFAEAQGSITSSAELGELKQVRNGRTVFFSLFILGSNTDTCSGK
jgi:hypothetical protein